MSQTFTLRGITPAGATRSSNPELEDLMQPATRKRHVPHQEPSKQQPSTPHFNPTFMAPATPGGSQAVPNIFSPATAGSSSGAIPVAGTNPGKQRAPADGDPDDGGNAPPPHHRGGGNPDIGDDLIEAISILTQAMQPKQHAKLKAREPDQFDSSNPKKLHTFLMQCRLYFHSCKEDFINNVKRINFALSYLKGSALQWFEPYLLGDLGDNDPEWSYDWDEFVLELQVNFGMIDPKREAAEKLDHLEMKDSQKITKYNIKFNSLAATLRYPSEVLYHAYQRGLPDRIKDTMSQQREKPRNYTKLCEMAQQLDARYWEHQ